MYAIGPCVVGKKYNKNMKENIKITKINVVDFYKINII